MTRLSDADYQQPVNQQLLRLIGLTLLGFMIPIATLSRNLLGEPGSIVLSGILLSGSLIILARAALIQALPRQLLVTLGAASPILVIYGLSTMVHFELSAVTNLAQLALVLGFMAGLSFVKWERSSLSPLFWIFSVTLFVHVLWWLAAGSPDIFQGPMSHPNGLALFAFLLAYVPLMVWRASRHFGAMRLAALPAALCSAILLYASTSRASWLAAVVAISVFMLWRPVITRGRWWFHLTFLFVIVSTIVATSLYMVAPSYAWGWQLNELTIEITGKNLFSGRQLFWGDLTKAVIERPWLGHGAGAIAETFTGYSWSAHNLYLQTALQVGLVGLGALTLLLWVMWAQLWRGRRSFAVRLAAAYFLGILVHQVFEVSLTQNNLANGFLIWFIMAVALSHVRHTHP